MDEKKSKNNGSDNIGSGVDSEQSFRIKAATDAIRAEKKEKARQMEDRAASAGTVKRSAPVISSSKKDDDEIVFYDNRKNYYTADTKSNTQKNNKEEGGHISGAAPGKRVSKKKITRKRLAFNIISIFLGIVMILSGAGSVMFYAYMSRINYQEITNESSVGGNKKDKSDSQNSNPVNTNTYEGQLLNDKQILNVLLIGADTRHNQTTGQSDSMILLSVDTRNKKLKLLSFMRDTYVSIPGYDDAKLNASFSYGGADLTVRTIQLNYGIQIDRYAVVDFKSFKNIIDTLGGLDIELTEEEVDYIDWQTWSNNQADTRHELDASKYTYKPNKDGENVTKIHLNGRQALWHSRNRGEEGICSGDDYTRTLRQRNVISLMINKLKGADLPKIMNIVYEIGPMITTNLKTSEITSLASNILKYLKYDIVSQSAPDYEGMGTDFVYSDDYEPVYINGEQVSCILILDWDEFRNKVAKFVFYDTNPLKYS